MAWQDDQNKLLATGMSMDDVRDVASQKAAKMSDQGVSTEEFQNYFGKPPEPETGHISDYFNQVFKQHMPETHDEAMQDPSWMSQRINAAKAGLENSVFGLGLRHQLPEHDVEGKSIFFEGAPWYDRAIEAGTQGVADLPWMAAGAVAGGPAAMGTAFALPAGMRKALVTSYEQGGVHSWSDFSRVAKASALDAAKQFAVGTATGLAGGATRAATSMITPGVTARVAQTLAPFTAETAAMTKTDAYLNDRIPKAQDFLDSAIVLAGFHAIGAGSDGIKSKLHDIYADTGVHPNDVVKEALQDPLKRQTILGNDTTPKDVFPGQTEPQFKSTHFVVDGKLVDADEAVANGELDKTMTPAQFEREEASRYSEQNLAETSEKLGIPKDTLLDHLKQNTEDRLNNYNLVLPHDLPETKLEGSLNEEFTPANELQAKLKVLPKPKPEGEKFSKYTFMRDYINDQERQRILSKEAQKAIGNYPITMNPESQAFMGRGSKDRANVWLGTPKEKENSTFGVYNYKGEKISDSLSKSLDLIPEKDFEDFRKYTFYRHIKDLKDPVSEAGITREEAQSKYDEGKKNPNWEKAAKGVTDWNNAITKVTEDEGLISKGTAKLWSDQYPNYTPLKRVQESGGALGPSKTNTLYHARIGSDLPMVDNFAAMVDRARNSARAIEINRAKKATIESIKAIQEDSGEKSSVEDSPVQPEMDVNALEHDHEAEDKKLGDSKFGFFEDGKYKVFDTKDPELAMAVKRIDFDPFMMKMADPFYRAMRAGSKLTTNALAMTPDFAVRHVTREQLFTFMNSDQHMIPFFDMAKKLGMAFGEKSDLYVKAKLSDALNGVISNTPDLDPKFLLSDSHGAKSNVQSLIKNALGAGHAMLKLTSVANRLAVFDKALQSRAAEQGVDVNDLSWDKVLEAGAETRNSMISAIRTGAKMRALNAITSFQSYGIQGEARTFENIAENPGRTSMRGAILAGATLALAWAQKDDREINDLPDYQKFAYWNINTGKEIFRIAKPWSYGTLYGTMFQAAFDVARKEDPQAIQKVGENFIRALPLSFPTFPHQLLDMAYNFDSLTDRNILSPQMLKQAPLTRATQYTSATANFLARGMSHIPGLQYANISSPKMIDKAIYQWSGGLGKLMVNGMDKILEKQGLAPPSLKPPMELSTSPFIGALIAQYPTYAAEPLHRFEEEFKKIEMQYNSHQVFLNTDRQDQADKYEAEHPDVNMYDEMKQVKDMLDDQNKIIQTSELDSSSSASDKKQLTQGYWRDSIDAAKEALKRIDENRKAK